ncbi:MAG: hypothetical protein ACREBU_17445, partial [Nitrososphaera sp.]
IGWTGFITFEKKPGSSAKKTGARSPNISKASRSKQCQLKKNPASTFGRKGSDDRQPLQPAARNPNPPEGERLPPPMEIVASLMEKEREILSIIEELDEMLANNRMDFRGQCAAIEG